MVYFFQASLLHSTEHTKFWPILVNFGYFVANLRTLWRTFYRPKLCGGVPKLTNIGFLSRTRLWRGSGPRHWQSRRDDCSSHNSTTCQIRYKKTNSERWHCLLSTASSVKIIMRGSFLLSLWNVCFWWWASTFTILVNLECLQVLAHHQWHIKRIEPRVCWILLY